MQSEHSRNAARLATGERDGLTAIVQDDLASDAQCVPSDRRRSADRLTDHDRRRRYAAAALDRECTEVAAQCENRNDRLNKAAFALGGLIDPDALNRTEVEVRLLAAAHTAGLDAVEARSTIRSGIDAGLKAPRDLAAVHSASRTGISSPCDDTAPIVTDPGVFPDAGALAVWEVARPATGSVVEIYLRRRGITGTLPQALRFAQYCGMPDGGSYPCMVASVSVPTTGEVIAVQRTALHSDGKTKAAIVPAKASLGSTRGGAVVLGDLFADSGPICEGEGVETVLSVLDALGLPGIATLSQSTLGKPQLPPGRDVVILVDRGAEAAVRAAAARRAREGRLVRLAHVPPDVRPGENGADANDVFRDRGPDGVRDMIERAEPFRPEPTAAELPDGYRRRADGQLEFARTDDSDDGETWLPLCSPLEILAATRDGEGRAWGRLVRVRDDDGQWNEMAVPMSWLAGDGRELRSAMLALGLVLVPGNAARHAFTRLFCGPAPAQRARCVARLGWHSRAYVLPDAIIGDSGGERIVWQPETPSIHAFRVGGSLDGWRGSVATPAAGNSRLVLAISAALGGSLLTPLGLEGGGFHIRGTSSTGKTTLLRVAGSVWGGGGIDGFIRRWRATDNGLEGVALMHCDGLLCLDELAEIDSRDAYRAAYMLANGQGKQRAFNSGGGIAPQCWRLLFLSTGEISLAEKVAEDGRRVTAGQEVRVIDVAADAGAGLGLFEDLHGAGDADAFARQLTQATVTHYGHAARAFLDAVAYDMDRSLGRVRQAMRDFEGRRAPVGASGQVRRVLARFALVAAAGELAAHFDVVPWEAGEATAGVDRCWRDWLVERGGSGDREAERAISQVRAFIEAHGASRFAPLTPGNAIVPNRVGFYSLGPDGERTYYVLPEQWKVEVCRGLDPKAVGRVLRQRGMLQTEQGRCDARVRLPGLERSRCYVLTPALFKSCGPIGPTAPEPDFVNPSGELDAQ